MKKLTRCITFILTFVLFTTYVSSQSANEPWAPLNTNKINKDGKAKTLGAVYSKTYFQARFMSVKAIVLDVIFPHVGNISLGNSLIQKKLNKANKSTDSATIQRINNNEFEKKLGDFDVMSYFFNAFFSLTDSIKYFDIQLTFNQSEHLKLVHQLNTSDNRKLDFQLMKTLKDSGSIYISGFKFQYGVGARFGKEQLGFTKTYRPFVRLVGLIKKAATNEVIWGNRIVIFSDKSFHGGDEAKNATPEDLISAFKDISDKLSKVVIDDINGIRYSSEEQLVGVNNKDDVF